MDSQHAQTKKNVMKTIWPDLAEVKKKNMHLSSAAFHLLTKHYESKWMHDQRSLCTTFSPWCSHSQKWSTVDIIKMARETEFQCTSQNSGKFSHANPCLPPEKYKDFGLALLLQAAAINFSNQQFDIARSLLSICQHSASITGNPLQRVVFYFTEALQERIMVEMGEIALHKKSEGNDKLTVEESFMSLHPIVIECENKLPFRRVTQFAAIQAILDNVTSSKRIHLIDLGIKSGSHWPIMIQAFADKQECPLELLKITTVAPYKDKERIEEIGKYLSSFAESLSIPFVFKVVVSDLKNLHEDFFELAADEVLAVYSEMCLATLLAWPDRLESLLATIKKLQPCVMVIVEVESKTNSPIFMDRFNAALSVSAALFDCLEVCMDHDNQCRDIVEGGFLKEGIQYNITSKGKESIHRQESIDFWRAFLTTFGMVEITLSNCALYQANLVVKSNPCWSSCTLEENGQGLTIGWKGIPVHLLTVWKC